MSENQGAGNGGQVPTPGGMLPKESVHLVPSGTAVHPGMAADMVFTPGGPRPRSQVRLVQPGAAVEMKGARPRAVLAAADAAVRRPQPPGKSNWITYTFWQNATGSPVTSFRTTWKVPPNPTTQASQLIYLFNGLSPADNSFILQPVLQWGDSGKDEDGVQRTGPFWSIASWSVSDTEAHHTPHIRANPGDTLVGLMSLTGNSGGSFSYSCEFDGIDGTNHPIVNVPELVALYETLEAYELNATTDPPYDLDSAAEYPASTFTLFHEIGVATGVSRLTGTVVHPTLAWEPVNIVTSFGEHAVVVNNSPKEGAVELFYGPSRVTPRG